MSYCWMKPICGFFLLAYLLVACSVPTEKPQAPAPVSRPAPSVGPSEAPPPPPEPSATPLPPPPVASVEKPKPQVTAPVLEDVYYDFDQYNLRPDAVEALKANAEWIRSNPVVRLEIQGHADERGTTQYNLSLGARRARASKDYLTSLGIAPERLSTISYGEELPVCREKTEECWQRNRRAHFVVISPGTTSTMRRAPEARK